MKTAEQILDEYPELESYLGIPERNSVCAAMEQYASQSKWVSVSERLPEVNVKVLGVYHDPNSLIIDDPEVVRLTKDGKWYKPFKNIEITHWMEIPFLPSPPTEQP